MFRDTDFAVAFIANVRNNSSFDLLTATSYFDIEIAQYVTNTSKKHFGLLEILIWTLATQVTTHVPMQAQRCGDNFKYKNQTEVRDYRVDGFRWRN